jgi:hypothetical protein
MTSRKDETNQQLDQALEQSFPASDPPSLTQPAGDARDAAACCCNPERSALVTQPAAVAEKKSGCCGGKGKA